MQLTINTNTVAKAYEKLTEMGLIESRKGLGLFVSNRRQLLSDEERTQRLHVAVDEFVTNIIDLDFNRDEIISHLEHKMAQLVPEAPEND